MKNKTNIPDDVLELRRLGYTVIPSGGGPSGKAPLIRWKNWQGKVPSEDQLRQWQEELNPSLWGIVTNKEIAVVDGDTPEAVERLRACLGEPHVITPRGAHWYINTQGRLNE